YGSYIVLRHEIEGLEIYSLYGHLSEVRTGLKVGQAVKAGEMIAVMGRTGNNRERNSKERAHGHFQLKLVVNDRFALWYKRTNPSQQNDHGNWNGQNLLGLDPRLILMADHSQGAKFSLLEYVRHQNELFRVVVRKTDFPWTKRYRALLRRNP